MLSSLRQQIRKQLAGSSKRLIGFYHPEELRQVWPSVPPLQQENLHDARLYASRDEMLNVLPKFAIGAEVGIFRCAFTEVILKRTEPSKLHLFDIDSVAISLAKGNYADRIAADKIEVHHGDSATALSAMGDSYFDWVYVDGDHGYHGVRRDIDALYSKVKPGGLIVFNDYTFFDPLSLSKFGVMEAVNELCNERGLQVAGFALHGRGFNDIMVRKPLEQVAAPPTK